MAKQKKDDAVVVATREDIERALASLTPSDQRRLSVFARYKVLGLGRKRLGRDHTDLLQEAFGLTIEGSENNVQGRRWYKGQVDFVGHLLGVMRSVASHWKEAFDENEAYLESEVVTESDDGEFLSPLAAIPSNEPSQDRVVIGKEELGRVYRLFQNDDIAALVIEGIREEWTGPEIMDRLAIPKDKYEAAMKRIRYHVR